MVAHVEDMKVIIRINMKYNAPCCNNVPNHLVFNVPNHLRINVTTQQHFKLTNKITLIRLNKLSQIPCCFRVIDIQPLLDILNYTVHQILKVNLVY